MFEATRSLLLFDYFRVPYEIAPAEEPYAVLRRAGSGPVLAWPRSEVPAARAGRFRLGSIVVHAHAVPDEVSQAWRERLGGGWTRWLPLVGDDGEPVASAWRAEDGSVFLPFDPDEAIRNCWSEGYLTLGGGGLRGRLVGLARHAYYFARPLLPRRLQIGVRRLFSRVQRRAAFPRWPVEPALHDLYSLLFTIVRDVAGTAVPALSPWPRGYSWALVLTHDVETRAGYENLEPALEAEARAGFRSAWNFVPERDYSVEEDLLERLRGTGHEVGVHGLRHDGFDLDGAFEERLTAMQEYGRRWNAAGFRAPSLQRVWEWMPRLGFDYDSSYGDTVPFEPQSGGCCTWLPFHNGDLVELPITLPHDHTVFEILQEPDERLWVDKARLLRDRGGMALMLTHPDYLLDRKVLTAYERFLGTFADDETAWKPLPRELASWWRRRADSRLEPCEQDGWRVVGPAADDAELTFL